MNLVIIFQREKKIGKTFSGKSILRKQIQDIFLKNFFFPRNIFPVHCFWEKLFLRKKFQGSSFRKNVLIQDNIKLFCGKHMEPYFHFTFLFIQGVLALKFHLFYFTYIMYIAF